jgi:hypothetical protein
MAQDLLFIWSNTKKYGIRQRASLPVIDRSEIDKGVSTCHQQVQRDAFF